MDEYDELENDEDLKDFIENDEEDEDNNLEFKRYRQSSNKFFRTSINDESNKKIQKSNDFDKSAALKEDFFKNLVAQLPSSEGAEIDAQSENEDLKGFIEEVESKSFKNKRKGNENSKMEPKKRKGKGKGKASKEDSSSEEEFLPTCEMAVAFPELAPEISLNQLEINNAKAMEIDDEDFNREESTAVDFPDEADLQKFEEEMSFIIESNCDNSQLVTIDNTPPLTVCAPIQIQKSADIQSSQRSLGLVASAEEFLENDHQNDGSCLVYWFDAYERQPNGPVYLFGKMKDSKSTTGVSTCCIIVENLQRNVFFLPREATSSGEPISFQELQSEGTQIAAQHGITRFGTKQVTRKYAFELPQVPHESEYLKMVYPYNFCIIPVQDHQEEAQIC